MGKDNDDVKIPIVETHDRRDLYLGFLEDAINNLHHKAIVGKVRNPQNERIKIEYFRALIYAVNTANTIYKDKQLDKLEEEMELLKRGLIFDREKSSKSDNTIDEEKQKRIDKLDEEIDKMIGRE